MKEEYRKRILQFTDLLRISEKNSRKNSKLLKERMLNQKPGNCCTLVYTSGTTGFPKVINILLNFSEIYNKIIFFLFFNFN